MANARTNCFVDTNVLVYAADLTDPEKWQTAKTWIVELAGRNALIVSPQTINEFYRVSRRRFPDVSREDVVRACQPMFAWCRATLDSDTIRRAWLIEEKTGYQWFDCVLLASAALAECGFFVSEDLQHGRIVDGMTIVDPFRVRPEFVISS